MGNEPEHVAVSIAEAQKSLGVSHGTIYRLINTGQLRTRMVGRRRLVPVSALREFIEAEGDDDA